MDKPCSEVLINELTMSCKFLLGQGVDGAERQSSAFVQGELEIVQLGNGTGKPAGISCCARTCTHGYLYL